MADETTREEVSFLASKSAGNVSGIVLRPARPASFLVLAHGAGAGMRHAFLEALAARLAAGGVATLRWQFPYTEKGSRRPDPQPILLAAVRSAAATGRALAGDLPLFAGGKSMGGRMTSLAAAKESLPDVRGLVFFGFPLHPAGKPSIERAAHLASTAVPLLFLQGTRDTLADLTLLRPMCEGLGARAELRIFDDADHSFHVRKKSGRDDDAILTELAAAAATWMRGLGKERA
ncbi:MAG: alpha/beta family hydrolase [bacterium]